MLLLSLLHPKKMLLQECLPSGLAHTGDVTRTDAKGQQKQIITVSMLRLLEDE